MSDTNDFLRQARIAALLGEDQEDTQPAKVKGEQDDALVSQETVERMKKAGALAAVASRWTLGKAKEAGQAGLEKARLAREAAERKRAESETRRIEESARLEAEAQARRAEAERAEAQAQVRQLQEAERQRLEDETRRELEAARVREQEAATVPSAVVPLVPTPVTDSLLTEPVTDEKVGQGEADDLTGSVPVAAPELSSRPSQVAPSVETSQPARRKSRWPLVAGAFVLLGAAGGALFYMGHEAKPAPVAPAASTAPVVRPVAPAIAPVPVQEEAAMPPIAEQEAVEQAQPEVSQAIPASEPAAPLDKAPEPAPVQPVVEKPASTTAPKPKTVVEERPATPKARVVERPKPKPIPKPAATNEWQDEAGSEMDRWAKESGIE